MSRLVLRSVHTTAALANTGVASAASALGAGSALTEQSTATSDITPARKFTPKGRLIPSRPPRTTRVTMPSGYPEPPSYPPPTAYFEELAQIKKDLAAKGQNAPKKHPLWAFFHVPRAATIELSQDAEYPPDMGSVERLDDEQVLLESGRSWSAKELRLKSFEDLHTLWYILLRERNVLATQREERRRLSISPGYGGDVVTKRMFRCRKSMARIKYVLNERRLALLSAGVPSLNAADETFAPSTLPGLNDPMAQIEALHGTAPMPSLTKLTGAYVKRAPRSQSEAAQAEMESDMFEGEDGLEKEMAEVEAEERAEREKEAKEKEAK